MSFARFWAGAGFHAVKGAAKRCSAWALRLRSQGREGDRPFTSKGGRPSPREQSLSLIHISLQKDPGNTRIQEDLKVLWNQMTPEEQKLALRGER